MHIRIHSIHYNLGKYILVSFKWNIWMVFVTKLLIIKASNVFKPVLALNKFLCIQVNDKDMNDTKTYWNTL